LTFGKYEKFPSHLHRVDGFHSTLTIKQLQQKLLHTLQEINRKQFSFEEVTDPTLPNGIVIFEFGLANGDSFSYLDTEELESTLDFVSKERVQALDFFCAIRYYKNIVPKSPLKFDYYLLRTVFGKELLEMQVFHERGPRYVSTEDLVEFIIAKLNMGQNRKILKPLTT
jgi:hypothetical protein